VIKVLLVDDQALVRSGFRMILEAKEDLEVIGEAADGREAVELAQVTSPDVILIDVACRSSTASRRRGRSSSPGPRRG
jgi:YesN/AraC family two-component response regulator